LSLIVVAVSGGKSIDHNTSDDVIRSPSAAQSQ